MLADERRGEGAARGVREQLAAAGLRAELDLRNEKINYKVREHSLAKVPYIFVLGEREAAENTVSVRKLGDKQQEVLAQDKAVDIGPARSTVVPVRLTDRLRGLGYRSGLSI